MSIIYLTCPHCNDGIEINLNEINCKIYRHGVYKNNYQQIDPHMKKETIDELKEKDSIFGCGRPFEIIKSQENEWKLVVCDYI